jgi:hypothetical protein
MSKPNPENTNFASRARQRAERIATEGEQPRERRNFGIATEQPPDVIHYNPKVITNV